MDYQSLLNDKQYNAVSTASQYVRVVAGAGSGKTRVLTYRISYLISEMHVNPSSILAIAFTNKVANEMKDRACRLVPEASSSLSVMTFHSFCAKFLRREVSALSFPSNFTIYDDDDQERLVKSIAEKHGYKKNDDIVKLALSFISEEKCHGNYPKDVKLPTNATKIDYECLEFFKEYEESKDKMYGFDFDDLLLRAIMILNEFSQIREKWQKRIDHILVDEFQDTNDVQFTLIKLLVKPSTCVYVVGDPDQTIYTWRGANQDIILNFENSFPNAETIILDQNYRSTQTILDTANKLIDHNKKRVKKALFTNNQRGEAITVYKAFSKEIEAEWVIKQIINLSKSDPSFNYRKVVVLYRSSYLTLPFEKELAKKQIPYRMFGGLRFYQRKEIKDVLAYVRLIFNPLDNVSFERIVNVPRRGIGDMSIDILKSEAFSANESIYNYIAHLDRHSTELKTKAVTALTSMVNLIEKYKARFHENLELYSKIIEEMIQELGYMDYLTNDDDSDERIENVKALFTDMYDFVKKNPESSFENYLENVTLATSQDDINEGNYVSLMTVHIAKGLEFDYVFVIGLNEGVFPSARTMTQSGNIGLEEERRLCYVAYTRAKKRLLLSCNTDYSFIQQSHQIPSRFFGESCLLFPKEEPYYKAKRPFVSSLFEDNGFFVEEKKEEIHTDNGITNWKVGDVAIHQKFGEGIVVKVLDDGQIIEVNFDREGKKTMLAKHPMLSRKESVGGKA